MAECTRSDERGSSRTDEDANDDGHLIDVPDGSGCTEIWEHLSERRTETED